MAFPEEPEFLPPDELIFGGTASMQQVRSAIERIAHTNLPVLIQGESGTGKEVLARVLHSRSAFEGRVFLKTHCAPIPGRPGSDLFQLLSQTGPSAEAPPVAAAESATLFLDDVAELDSAAQVRVLHLLEAPSAHHLGRPGIVPRGFRLICATRHCLEEEIQAGRFRQDLFYRINVITLELPRLRERRQDIPGLANYFLQYYSTKYGRLVPALSAALLDRLQDHNWPGNIRELENQVANYVVLGPNAFNLARRTASLATFATPSEHGTFLRKVARQASRDAQREMILRVLEENGGNRKLTARALNISYRGLLYKIKEVGIPRKRSHAAIPGSIPKRRWEAHSGQAISTLNLITPEIGVPKVAPGNGSPH